MMGLSLGTESAVAVSVGIAPDLIFCSISVRAPVHRFRATCTLTLSCRNNKRTVN